MAKVISVKSRFHCLSCGSDQWVLMEGEDPEVSMTYREFIGVGWTRHGSGWICPTCLGREEASWAAARKRKNQETIE